MTTTNLLSVRRVQCDVSPFFYAFYLHHVVKIVIDSGAQSSMISASFVRRVNLQQEPTLHGARQLDKSAVKISGELRFELSFGTLTLPVDGLVNENLDCDILAGVPFCKENKIHLAMADEQISIQGHTIPYGCKPDSLQRDVYHVNTMILRNDQSTVVYPGDYIEVSSEKLDVYENEEVAIEPRIDSPLQGEWPPPSISRVIQGSIRIPNNSTEPIKIKKCQHFAQIRRVTTSDVIASLSTPDLEPVRTDLKMHPSQCNIRSSLTVPHSSSVLVDPDGQLSADMRQQFNDLNKRYDNVFNPKFSRYNGASGPFIGDIKFGKVEPPSSKTKMPFYNQSDLRQLQLEADKLEELGVLVKPEDVGVDLKFASPSFLRNKPCGGVRFVTSFVELAQYTRTLPVATVTADSIIRRLAQWKYVIKTDLTQSFFQIPVSKKSMSYLGTATPFKGLRVYSTIVMGMPGSSELLQELLSRVLGDEMTEGWTLIIADDMYVCANSLIDLIHNWETVLSKMHKNNLSLKAAKTFICPKNFEALGWKWESGKLSITPHKISSLASADPPKTVTNMRSFTGAFKALSRCIRGYSSLMSPLEEAIKGKSGPQKIEWNDSLHEHFSRCKEALKSPTVLTIPIPTDQLILTVDASPINSGIGATLFVSRNGKRLVADFFSMKLKSHHLSWEPCEMEALAIASGVQHFSPYIRESIHPVQILSDNKPCVQAYSKLRKGHFSASARVSAFLSTLSQYSVVMCHLKGQNNTSSDYASRHPQTCSDASCQICKFVNELSTSVVRQVSVEDVLSGSARMPFLNKAAWKTAQHGDRTLRRVYAHLTQGTRPSKKAKNVRSVKRYVSVCTVDDQGFVIVKKSDPFLHERELIVVPHEILPGLLTAIHIQFNHASKSQLIKLFDRYFYGISYTTVIEDIVHSCTHCNSLKPLNKELFAQTSTASPTTPGQQFAGDVIERVQQKILIVREVLTSFTSASIIRDQKADTLRCGILDNTSLIRLPSSVIRVDNAPGFASLKDDEILSKHGIKLDFGRIKNVNKNPVAERCNQELELELLHIDPSGNPVSNTNLQNAVKSLNTRIRSRGLSSQEMLLCRDQVTGDQLRVDDLVLSREQEITRERNHIHSAQSKAKGGLPARDADVTRGDLVFIKSEGSKNKSRDMYIVMDINDRMASLQKLTGSKFQSRKYDVPLTNIFSRD